MFKAKLGFLIHKLFIAHTEVLRRDIIMVQWPNINERNRSSINCKRPYRLVKLFEIYSPYHVCK